MENASKALIIAGAILLAILLISLGIMIYNQAQDTVSNSGMDQAAVTAFNNQFLKYEGNQKGTMVKSLIQEVRASNASDTANQVQANGTTEPVTSNIVNANTYSVTLGYGGTGGRVNTITIMNGSIQVNLTAPAGTP